MTRHRVVHVVPDSRRATPPTQARDETGALARCREIRRVVFVQEQSVPADLEWDGLDGSAEHFLVFASDETAASARGTARLRIVDGEAKAERVAVLAAARGQGLGRALMAAIEVRARALSLPGIRLNAQLAVVPFYEKLGYVVRGEVFVEAGIDHLAMTKALAASHTDGGDSSGAAALKRR